MLIAVLIFFSSKKNSEEAPLSFEANLKSGPCPGVTEVLKAQDKKTYNILHNFYSCNPVKRGDLIYLKFSEQLPAVIRTVYGIPGDSFALVFDKENNNWNLKINDELVLDPEKTVHFFGGKSRPVLGLYEKSLKNHLPAKNFIVFSDQSPGHQDSSILGVVNVEDFVGKVELGQ